MRRVPHKPNANVLLHPKLYCVVPRTTPLMLTHMLPGQRVCRCPPLPAPPCASRPLSLPLPASASATTHDGAAPPPLPTMPMLPMATSHGLPLNVGRAASWPALLLSALMTRHKHAPLPDPGRCCPRLPRHDGAGGVCRQAAADERAHGGPQGGQGAGHQGRLVWWLRAVGRLGGWAVGKWSSCCAVEGELRAVGAGGWVASFVRPCCCQTTPWPPFARASPPHPPTPRTTPQPPV